MPLGKDNTRVSRYRWTGPAPPHLPGVASNARMVRLRDASPRCLGFKDAEARFEVAVRRPRVPLGRAQKQHGADEPCERSADDECVKQAAEKRGHHCGGGGLQRRVLYSRGGTTERQNGQRRAAGRIASAHSGQGTRPSGSAGSRPRRASSSLRRWSRPRRTRSRTASPYAPAPAPTAIVPRRSRTG